MGENRSSGFPSRSDTNRPVHSQKKARLLKFWIYVEEELYYPCSENKGADRLRSYCEADLCLCFRIGKNPVFSRCGSLVIGSYQDSQMCCIRYVSLWSANDQFCMKKIKKSIIRKLEFTPCQTQTGLQYTIDDG